MTRKKKLPATLETIAEQLDKLCKDVSYLRRGIDTLAGRIIPYQGEITPPLLQWENWVGTPEANLDSIAEVIGEACQSASKFDPLSASNFDPGGSEPRASALCIAP